VSRCTSLRLVSKVEVTIYKWTLTVRVGTRRACHDDTSRDTRRLATASTNVGENAVDRDSRLGLDEGVDGRLTAFKITQRSSLGASEKESGWESMKDVGEQHDAILSCERSW
jgi:hypothetical protein